MAIKDLTRTGTTFRSHVTLAAVLAVALIPAGPAPVAASTGPETTNAVAEEPVPNHSAAGGINDDGWVVGSATSSDGPYTQHPVLWQPRTREIVDLGTMGGYDWGGASAINDKGQIVGSFGTLDDGLAFLRRPSTGAMVDLGTLGGESATATDINDNGQVVGWSITASGDRRPFLWRPKTGQMENLGTLGDRTHSMAVAINDDATVLGMAWTPRTLGTTWHAWLWKPGLDHLIRLESRGLPDSTRPEDVNDKGQVVGCTWRDDSPRTAVLWRPKSERSVRLESLGGDACAWAISNRTEVVGWSVNSSGDTRAFRWSPGMDRVKGLGTLGGPSSAIAVNGDGQIVGSFGESTTAHAFLWEPTTSRMTDLGLLVSTCEARNLTTGSPVDPDLQAVIDAASSGDTVEVAGECQGGFTIFSKSLTLVGSPTVTEPVATLDGQGRFTVLRLGGDGTTVELRDLLITHGWNDSQGGGIQNSNGTLLLTGQTSVTRNVAEGLGGGIENSQALLWLQDSASVSNNSAESGAGIFSYEGPVTLSSTSSVNGNSAGGSGGGILSFHDVVTVQDTASVTGNSASAGGGISKNFGPVLLLGDASVTDNTARYGAGLYIWGRARMSDASVVAQNTATVTGGGIQVGFGDLLLEGSASITQNAADKGGGIHTTTDVTLTGLASVTLNVAATNGGGIFNDGGSVTLLDSAVIVDNIPNDCAHCS